MCCGGIGGAGGDNLAVIHNHDAFADAHHQAHIVLDNVKVAFNQSMGYSMVEGIFRFPRYWRGRHAAPQR